MAKDMIDPTNWSQNDVQRFCFNQEWKRKKHRYGIDMIRIDDGWLVKWGREETFCDRLQDHAVLGVYEIWLCIEA